MLVVNFLYCLWVSFYSPWSGCHRQGVRLPVSWIELIGIVLNVLSVPCNKGTVLYIAALLEATTQRSNYTFLTVRNSWPANILHVRNLSPRWYLISYFFIDQLPVPSLSSSAPPSLYVSHLYPPLFLFAWLSGALGSGWKSPSFSLQLYAPLPSSSCLPLPPKTQIAWDIPVFQPLYKMNS